MHINHYGRKMPIKDKWINQDFLIKNKETFNIVIHKKSMLSHK